MAKRERSDGEITLAPSKSRTAVEKTCATCGETKPAQQFWRTHASPDLLTASCRQCIVANAQKDREAREARRLAADAVKAKTCKCCNSKQPLTAFAPNRNSKDGRRRTCNSCLAAGKTRTRSSRNEQSKARDRARRVSKRGREVSRACTKAWKENNPEAVLAQKAVAAAIRRGVLARPVGCQVHGCKFKGKPHAHHPDYRFPLAVFWACGSHHKQLHAGANLDIVPGLPPELLRVPGQPSAA